MAVFQSVRAATRLALGHHGMRACLWLRRDGSILGADADRPDLGNDHRGALASSEQIVVSQSHGLQQSLRLLSSRCQRCALRLGPASRVVLRPGSAFAWAMISPHGRQEQRPVRWPPRSGRRAYRSRVRNGCNLRCFWASLARRDRSTERDRCGLRGYLGELISRRRNQNSRCASVATWAVTCAVWRGSDRNDGGQHRGLRRRGGRCEALTARAGTIHELCRSRSLSRENESRSSRVLVHGAQSARFPISGRSAHG